MAMEECVITSIIKEAMIATLHNEPKFSELFMAYLLTRNSRAERLDRLFQFKREATGAPSSSPRTFRKGRHTSAYFIGYQPETLAEMIERPDPA
jgi:hypothetical protein